MRLNKFIAQATGMSRRAADNAIADNRIRVNNQPVEMGQTIAKTDVVTLDGGVITADQLAKTIMLNKPRGYVCSRTGQGNKTIYDLLPEELHSLKPIGRLDKDSSGLILLTSDGDLAHQLTHPKFQKQKIYEIALDKPLQPLHRQMISDYGVELDDGPSKFTLERLQENDDQQWQVKMNEGRNRQIRRTFDTLGYAVTKLHRTNFGGYQLGDLPSGQYKSL